MATNPPHLLTLPREIRNQIYSYLHKEVEVDNERRPSILDVHVRLENAPYAALLLTNSQLYHEYREADSSWNLAAHIEMDVDPSYYLKSPVMARNREVSGLRSVQHVTIVDKRSMGLGFIGKYLVEKMPKLRTVRHLRGDGETHILEDSKLFSEWPLSYFDTHEHSLPKKFMGLPLFQVAVAKHVEYSSESDDMDGDFIYGDESEDDDTDGDYADGLVHAIKTLRLVTYSADDQPKKHTWTPKQGNVYWNSRRPYPQDLFNSLPPEKQAQIANFSTALVNWKEGCIATETHSLPTSGDQESAMDRMVMSKLLYEALP
jgi:hypothetical protein